MTSNQGVIKTDTILDKIIAHKREEIESAQAERSIKDLQTACQQMSPTRDFIAALQKETVALIAEVKRASPSKGVMVDPFHPVQIAQLYEQNGASAISVLTDETFFQGHLRYLSQIRQAVGLPLLRKDFLISPYQVYEARAAGADAVLLIVAALDDRLLAELYQLASELDLAALVEVHHEAELERALKLSPRLIGVNNRNLHDFSVDLTTTRRLAERVPSDVVLVGESGIRSAADVRQLGAVHAILVGETAVTTPNPAEKLQELSAVPRS